MVSASDKKASSDKVTLRLHLWLEHDKKNYVGVGRVLLLDKIEKLGSLRKAATAMNMSYRAAWGKIKAAEETVGQPLVRKTPTGGQRYEVTEFGKELVEKFINFYRDVENYALKKAEGVFPLEVSGYLESYGKGQFEES